MTIEIRKYEEADIPGMLEVWNEVVEAGRAFPQMAKLDLREGRNFFGEQSHCGVAVDPVAQKIVGLYILHPNNVGRCGHICNASYAVSGAARGLGIGRKLVEDSLEVGARLGFRIIQFNAVVKSNAPARALYEKLGFRLLGTIPGGFLRKDNVYEDICLYYRMLERR